MTADLTYAEVGATLTGSVADLPRDAHPFARREPVGRAADLDRAAAFVLGFGMQRGAGIRVSPADAVATTGRGVELRLGPGPLSLRAPVAVVGIVEEPDRRGFAYGTLAGHPERGEELFVVERVGEQLWAEVRAFSRPGRWYTALGGPVARQAQRLIARRYLAAVRDHLTAG